MELQLLWSLVSARSFAAGTCAFRCDAERHQFFQLCILIRFDKPKPWGFHASVSAQVLLDLFVLNSIAKKSASKLWSYQREYLVEDCLEKQGTTAWHPERKQVSKLALSNKAKRNQRNDCKQIRLCTIAVGSHNSLIVCLLKTSKTDKDSIFIVYSCIFMFLQTSHWLYMSREKATIFWRFCDMHQCTPAYIASGSNAMNSLCMHWIWNEASKEGFLLQQWASRILHSSKIRRCTAKVIHNQTKPAPEVTTENRGWNW